MSIFCIASKEADKLRLRRKHKIMSSFERLGRSDPDKQNINEDMLDKLNALYVDARYPGEFGLLPDGKPTIVEAKEFYEFAKYVYNVVTKYLSD